MTRRGLERWVKRSFGEAYDVELYLRAREENNYRYEREVRIVGRYAVLVTRGIGESIGDAARDAERNMILQRGIGRPMRSACGPPPDSIWNRWRPTLLTGAQVAQLLQERDRIRALDSLAGALS